MVMMRPPLPWWRSAALLARMGARTLTFSIASMSASAMSLGSPARRLPASLMSKPSPARSRRSFR
jgi:hypothetical protein